MTTYGSTSAPTNFTEYLDSVFSTSLANYSPTLKDNIASTNALLHWIMKGDAYEVANGGLYIAEDLMYALSPMDSYDGYDELSDATTDGITQAQFQWRQLAAPVSYSYKEMFQNQKRVIDLVKSKMKQCELGMQEGWSTAFMQGAGDGALTTAKTSSVNGSSFMDPLPRIVAFDPTTSTSIGEISQSTNTWWRNKTKTSAATTYLGYVEEMENIYNTCALGTGGAPNVIICDQISYELYNNAFFRKYQVWPSAPKATYPFECTTFKNAVIVMDEKIPDVYTNVASAATYGTMYFLNTQFFKIRYNPDRDFVMLKDEDGKSLFKPIKGDSRLGHIGWMGNVTVSNRRKQGVMGKIARTLS